MRKLDFLKFFYFSNFLNFSKKIHFYQYEIIDFLKINKKNQKFWISLKKILKTANFWNFIKNLLSKTATQPLRVLILWIQEKKFEKFLEPRRNRNALVFPEKFWKKWISSSFFSKFSKIPAKTNLKSNRSLPEHLPGSIAQFRNFPFDKKLLTVSRSPVFHSLNETLQPSCHIGLRKLIITKNLKILKFWKKNFCFFKFFFHKILTISLNFNYQKFIFIISPSV